MTDHSVAINYRVVDHVFDSLAEAAPVVTPTDGRRRFAVDDARHCQIGRPFAKHLGLAGRFNDNR